MAHADTKRSAAYSRAANRRKLIEAIGYDTVVFKIDEDDPNGEEFTFPHPMMYSKATKAALKPLDDSDTEGIVRILLDGPPDTEEYAPGQYDRFIEAGGDPDDIGETLTIVQIASQKALRTGVPLER